MEHFLYHWINCSIFWGLQNEYFVGMTTFWVWANVLMMRSVYCIYTSSDLYQTTEQTGQA